MRRVTTQRKGIKNSGKIGRSISGEQTLGKVMTMPKKRGRKPKRQ
jgi:hypothetical protein